MRVSVFLQDGKQHNDGSFTFAPNTKLYKGEYNISMFRFHTSLVSRIRDLKIWDT